jgi:hypothetical protein
MVDQVLLVVPNPTMVVQTSIGDLYAKHVSEKSPHKFFQLFLVCRSPWKKCIPLTGPAALRFAVFQSGGESGELPVRHSTLI